MIRRLDLAERWHAGKADSVLYTSLLASLLFYPSEPDHKGHYRGPIRGFLVLLRLDGWGSSDMRSS